MNGQRRYWLPGWWLNNRLVKDVDAADTVIQGDLEGMHRLPIMWAEAEMIDSADTLHGSVELWEFRYKRWGFNRPVHRAYVTDAAVWLQVDSTRQTAFWQAMSWWRRPDAVQHVDLLRKAFARMP